MVAFDGVVCGGDDCGAREEGARIGAEGVEEEVVGKLGENEEGDLVVWVVSKDFLDSSTIGLTGRLMC